MPKVSTINFEKLIDTLEGKALSDATFIIREANLCAAKNSMDFIDQENTDMVLNNILEVKQQKRSINFNSGR